MVSGRVGAALGRLDPRERFIIEQRVMSESPMTLKELGEHFGFSRERARQLEIRAKEKLPHGAPARSPSRSTGLPTGRPSRSTSAPSPEERPAPPSGALRPTPDHLRARAGARSVYGSGDVGVAFPYAIRASSAGSGACRADAEQPRRLRLVSVRALHRLGDELALDVVEHEPLLRDRAGRSSRDASAAQPCAAPA